MFEYRQKLMRIVDVAISEFNIKEKYLIENDLSERCMCARFAMCLSNALIDSGYQGYYVDVEYNRGAYGKDFLAKEIEEKKIVVDLIVHKRSYDPEVGYDNLICIEMKKSTDRRGCSNDEERLKKMTDYRYGFNYKIGIMLLINMSEHKLEVKNSFKCEA